MNQLLENENETIYLHINTNKNNTYLAYDKNNKEEQAGKEEEIAGNGFAPYQRPAHL